MQLSFQELFREGAALGYVADPRDWLHYRHLGNFASHAYDGNKAQQVYGAPADLLADAKGLHAALKAKNP